MTEITKTTVSPIRFLGILAFAPLLTNMTLIIIGGAVGFLLTSIITVFPATSDSLEGAKAAAIVLAFVSGFALFFGFLQYFLFGGAALWLLSRNYPFKPWVCAALLLCVNLILGSLIYLEGDQQFATLCLYYGSFYAPIWGAAFAWLYARLPFPSV